MKTYLFHPTTFHLVSIVSIHFICNRWFGLICIIQFKVSLSRNMAWLLLFVLECNDDIVLVHFLMNLFFDILIPFCYLLVRTLSNHLHKMCLFIPLYLLLVNPLLDHLDKMCVVFMDVSGCFLVQTSTLEEAVCWNIWIERTLINYTPRISNL